MVLTKKDLNHLTEYVEFEYRVITAEILNCYKTGKEMYFDKYMDRLGIRLLQVRGLEDTAIQRQMFDLTRNPTLENFFEFGKLLVGLPHNGVLTMQQILAVESEILV